MHDGQAARDSFAQVRPANNSLYWRAKAAVHWLEGDVAEARETAVHGLEVIGEGIMTGRQIAERTWLNNLLEKVAEV